MSLHLQTAGADLRPGLVERDLWHRGAAAGLAYLAEVHDLREVAVSNARAGRKPAMAP